MDAKVDKRKDPNSLSAEQVREYLRSHPKFFAENPEVLTWFVPPSPQEEQNIADFQSFAIRRLQQQLRESQERLDSIVDSARDNTSVLHQIHHAILGLVRARDLEQLLEVVTLDLVQLFQVDVVRLVLESSALELRESHYPEHHYSGIVFIDEGLIDEIFCSRHMVQLCADTTRDYFPGFEQIFSECTRIVNSCALLRLELRDDLPPAMLAIGVRERNKFHPKQGSELLQFLSMVLAERLESCLSQLDS